MMIALGHIINSVAPVSRQKEGLGLVWFLMVRPFSIKAWPSAIAKYGLTWHQIQPRSSRIHFRASAALSYFAKDGSEVL